MEKYLQNRFLNSLSPTLRPLQIISISVIGKEKSLIVRRLKKDKLGHRYEEFEYSQIGKVDPTDLIICTEVFKQADNPRKVLKELLGKSKKYVLIIAPIWNLPSLSKFIKTRGIKLASRKLPLPWAMVLLKKV